MKGASVDALLLTIVRVITMVIGFVCIKIVSVYFSLEDFGLYSQALLIVSTATSFSILGMTDAVNYFYNNTNAHKQHSKEEHLATIFGMQLVIGATCAVLILAGAPFLTEYFNNPALWGVYLWIALQPMLQNYIPMLQVLYISAGRTRSIVIVNLMLSLIRLGIIVTASFVTQSIITILALTLVCDILQVAYFVIDLRCHKIRFNVSQFRISLCKPVLSYAIPMAAFVIINSLMRDADKWVVGYFAATDDLAIYTNCSRVLPFDMLTMSFCTILVPIITRLISMNKSHAAIIYGHYLNLGLFTTTILVVPALFMSKDLLLCLYDAKYLPGLTIFQAYLIVDFIRFANVSLLYSASGNAHKLLKIVAVTFCINLIGAVILYHAIGLVGPALATIASMLISYGWYMHGSNQILDHSVFRLFRYRHFLAILMESSVAGAFLLIISNQFCASWGAVPRFMLLYLIAVATIAMLNRKHLLDLAKKINQSANIAA